MNKEFEKDKKVFSYLEQIPTSELDKLDNIKRFRTASDESLTLFMAAVFADRGKLQLDEKEIANGIKSVMISCAIESLTRKGYLIKTKEYEFKTTKKILGGN